MILHVYSLTVDITGYVHRAKMVPVFFSKIYSGNLSCTTLGKKIDPPPPLSSPPSYYAYLTRIPSSC